MAKSYTFFFINSLPKLRAMCELLWKLVKTFGKYRESLFKVSSKTSSDCSSSGSQTCSTICSVRARNNGKINGAYEVNVFTNGWMSELSKKTRIKIEDKVRIWCPLNKLKRHAVVSSVTEVMVEYIRKIFTLRFAIAGSRFDTVLVANCENVCANDKILVMVFCKKRVCSDRSMVYATSCPFCLGNYVRQTDPSTNGRKDYTGTKGSYTFKKLE